MPELLTRDVFRAAVFNRDRGKCVVLECDKEAVDAHHIMERRLFDDGGYYLDNGVSLCEYHHLMAEKTLLPPEGLRSDAGIEKIILPPHLYPDYSYDKWGNIQNTNGTRLRGELFFDESVQKVLAAGGVMDLFLPYVKYPRTYHLSFSPGRTEDDKTLKDCSQFEGKEVVATVKQDGENTTGYEHRSYIHARSLDSDSEASQSWVRNFLASRLFELPSGWRLCGENLYAKHSIHYQNLSTYFQLFSIWSGINYCLSWDDTVEWARLLDIETVPVIYRGIWDEEKIKGLFQKNFNGDEMEGFVVRTAAGFPYGAFRHCVAKYVRAEHVQTNQHWKRTKLTPNILKSHGI